MARRRYNFRGIRKPRGVKAVPGRRWIAGGVAAAAVLASAGAAVVLRRTRRPAAGEPADSAEAAPSNGQPAQPGAAVRQAVSAAAATVRDRTDAIAHRAVDGARHTVARARAASRGPDQSGEQPDGHSADGGRPPEPEATTPTS